MHWYRQPVRALAFLSLVGLFATDPGFSSSESIFSGLGRAPSAAAQGSSHPIVASRTAGGGALRNDDVQKILVSGPLINFESPPVKPLAFSSDGEFPALVVANTPDNSVVIFDTTGETLTQIGGEIPVGLDPVTVAFQPGSSGQLVWVANMISDDISIVDVGLGRVVEVIELGAPAVGEDSREITLAGDEPVNILFNDLGTHAFIVSQDGTVTAVDTTSTPREVVDMIALDCHKPRAAVMRNGDLVVAALHSGNNTTVVGRPVEVPLDNGAVLEVNSLAIVRAFPFTTTPFANSSLSPWPDVSAVVPDPPDVERIVQTNNVPLGDGTPEGGNEWLGILDILIEDVSATELEPSQNAVDELEAVVANITGENLMAPSGETARDILGTIIEEATATVDHDLIVIDVSDPSDLKVKDQIGEVGTSLTGMAVNPDSSSRLFVSNLEPRNLIRHEPELNGHFIDHEIVVVDDLSNPQPVATDLHEEFLPEFNEPGFTDTSASLANPVDIVFNASGSRAYVVALGPDRVGVLDGVTASVIARVDVGEGPRALAIDGDRDLLFVMNRTELSVSMLDVSSDTPQMLETSALFNPEPDEIKNGRKFLYSTQFSDNWGSSCALCHLDGRRDHLAWDLGDPDGELQPGPITLLQPLPGTPGDPLDNHPLKGPMVTQTLQGLVNHEPYHWRGDKPTFVDFNSAFAGLLGGSELDPADMDTYRAFIDTIAYPPNPYRHRDNTFVDERGQDGRDAYLALCDSCHMLAHDGAGRFDPPDDDGDFGLIMNTSGPQTQVVRQLRGAYQKFKSDHYNGYGVTHAGIERRDGQDHQLKPLFDLFPGLFPTDEEKKDMIAFITAFPTDAAPIVGWQVLSVGSVEELDRDNILLMIDRALQDPSECDVVVQGVDVFGESRSYVLEVGDDGLPIFEGDDDSLKTLDDLLTLVDTGDSLAFMAVPSGSGRRIAFDEDDGV